MHLSNWFQTDPGQKERVRRAGVQRCAASAAGAEHPGRVPAGSLPSFDSRPITTIPGDHGQLIAGQQEVARTARNYKFDHSVVHHYGQIRELAKAQAGSQDTQKFRASAGIILDVDLRLRSYGDVLDTIDLLLQRVYLRFDLVALGKKAVNSVDSVSSIF